MPASADVVSEEGLGREAGRIGQGYSRFNWDLSVGGFPPEAAKMEHDLARLDVVQKAIGAQRERRLAFTSRKS